MSYFLRDADGKVWGKAACGYGHQFEKGGKPTTFKSRKEAEQVVNRVSKFTTLPIYIEEVIPTNKIL